MNTNPTLIDLINDRIDAEEVMTRIFLAFRDKYPSATHTVECSVRPGSHLQPTVKITSSF